VWRTKGLDELLLLGIFINSSPMKWLPIAQGSPEGAGIG